MTGLHQAAVIQRAAQRQRQFFTRAERAVVHQTAPVQRQHLLCVDTAVVFGRLAGQVKCVCRDVALIGELGGLRSQRRSVQCATVGEVVGQQKQLIIGQDVALIVQHRLQFKFHLVPGAE